MNTSRIRAYSLLVIIVTAVACDKTPVAPLQTGPAVSTPLTITGPTAIAPGSAKQFHATARSGDGTTEDVTSLVTWTSSNAASLQVDATGKALGRAAGFEAISASFLGMTAAIQVHVLEKDRFQLTGTVVSASSRAPLAATIVAEDEDGVTQQTSFEPSGPDSYYRFDGLKAGRIRLTVSNPLCVTQSADVALENDTVTNFTLAYVSGPVQGYLKLTGPSTIVVGVPSLYHVEARYSDGTTNIGPAAWRSLAPSLEIAPFASSTAAVVGRSVGDGAIEVQARGLTTTFPIRVIAHRQFMLSGAVSDAETGEFLRSTIEVRDEAGVSIQTHSDMYNAGRYAIDVDPGTVRVTVWNATSDESIRTYATHTFDVEITGSTTRNIGLLAVRK